MRIGCADVNEASEEIQKLKETFFQEAQEILENLDELLVRLEESPEDSEILHEIFRGIHTLKGSSGIVEEFQPLGALAHVEEDLLDALRGREVPFSGELMEALFEAQDLLKTMLGRALEGKGLRLPGQERVIEKLKNLGAGNPQSAGGPQGIGTSQGGPRSRYRIQISLERDCLKNGIDPLQLLKNLDSRGEILEVHAEDHLPSLELLEPDLLYLNPISLTYVTGAPYEEVEEIFEFAMVVGEIAIQPLPSPPPSPSTPKRLGEILVEKGEISEKELEKALEEQERPIGEILVDQGAISRQKLGETLEEQRQRGVASQVAVKVNPEKLDNLMDLVGEMVISQTLLHQSPYILTCPDQELLKAATQLSKITRDIQYQVMSIRMVPLAQTFYKMRRIVRDVAQKSGKEVVLRVHGEETELDKTMIEQLNDPLVHLLRNAIDHGIEPPEERRRRGKPAHGTVWLSAAHQKGNIVIEVRDDGGGISREAVRQEALERGLIKAGEGGLTDEQLLDLLTLPGFSTAREVTDLSGRGVGLDVVKTRLQGLRGRIGLHTREGQGASMTISLPLTLAVIDGMLVRIGDQRYIIPLESMERAVRPGREEVYTVTGEAEVVKVMGRLLPLIRLYQWFQLQPDHPDPWESLLVIVEDGKRKACLMVDDLLGQQQVVIKSLGERFQTIRGFSGSTILGDGKVGLILDVAGLLDMALDSA